MVSTAERLVILHEVADDLLVRAYEHRRELQQVGELPAGEEQLHPRYSKPYLDDATGTALNDEVVVPPSLRGIELPTHSAEPGGRVASHSSCVAVHCRIYVQVAQLLGFSISSHKLQLGDPVVALGFAVSVREACVRCPQPKQGRGVLIDW